MLDEEEVEREPIIVIPRAPGELKVGDYVFACRWSDADPGDPWVVGHVSQMYAPEEPGHYGSVVVGDSPCPYRAFPRAMRITAEQGSRIVAEYPGLERQPQDYDAIARIFKGR